VGNRLPERAERNGSMATKALSVPVGLVNYYIPSPAVAKAKNAPESLIADLSRAVWHVPKALHRIATHWDGSFKIFPTALYAEVLKIAREYDVDPKTGEGRSGIRIHIVEEWVTKDPEQTAIIVRGCIARSLHSIIGSVEEESGLRGSLAKLIKKFDAMEATEADGSIIDRINDSKRKLEDAMTVAAAFALTEEYSDLRAVVTTTIEAELEAARTVLVRETVKKLKAAGVI